MSRPKSGSASSKLKAAPRPHSNLQQVRPWFLETRGKLVYLLRDGEELSSFAGIKLGPVRDITTGKEHAKGSEKALLVN